VRRSEAASPWRLLATLVAVLAACGGSSRDIVLPGAEGSRPETIPAIREWSAREGSAELGSSPSIVFDDGDLESVADVFADDLRRATGRAVAIGPSVSLVVGDVRLELGADDDALGDEGYRLELGEPIVISANAPHGVFNGTRTLLQLVAQVENGSLATLPAGVARDWPRYPERGLMVDIGRKHFTPEWLAARIRDVAYLKMNRLHLHFSENQGWRIESERHPEIVSSEHLTKAEVRELLVLAERHHVTVVPEIDMPGHMGAALRPHPELQLVDLLGRKSPNALDYTKPEGRRFAEELVDEYLDLFPGPFWHMGADEFLMTVPAFATPLDQVLYPQLEAYARDTYGPNATAKDGILGFINAIGDRVRARGKTLRLWNDGLSGGSVVTLHPETIVEWWSNLGGPSPNVLVVDGYRVVNCGWFPTYYVNGFPGALIPGYPSNTLPILPPQPDMRAAYETWQPHEFVGPVALTDDFALDPRALSPDEPLQLGVKMQVWNDDPNAATEEETAAAIHPRLRVIAQKAWSTPRLVPSYGEFQGVIARVGQAP
jgi:hexosaminidase